MSPHDEVVFSFNCCSSHIALIVLNGEEEEEEVADCSFVPNATCNTKRRVSLCEPVNITADSIGLSSIQETSGNNEATQRYPDDEKEFDSDCTDSSTMDAWRKLRASSATLGKVLDEKVGFSSMWCGIIQPTLETTAHKLHCLDQEHQLLKTTAESLTRGTDYIAQTLSKSMDEQNDTALTQDLPLAAEVLTGEADSTVETLSEHADTASDIDSSATTLRHPQAIHSLSRGVYPITEMPSKDEDNIEQEMVNPQCPHTADVQRQKTDFSATETLIPDVNTEEEELEKSTSQCESRARFTPSHSRFQERRAGMNV
jgi:hypothetical protein